MKLNASLRTYKLYWITLTLLVSACVPQSKPTAPPPKPTMQQQIQNEVTELLTQAYIDPITRFIFLHEQDKTYQTALKRLEQEKIKRCQQVAVRYKTSKKTQKQLDKLSKGYQFSCPDLVFDFAKVVAQEQALAQLSPKKRGNSEQQAETLQACNQSYEKMDYVNALRYCHQPALQGHAEAQLKLGMIYADGRGVKKDYQAAYIWLTLAVQSGIAQAQVLRDSIARLFTPKELIDAHDKAAKIANAY